uniref:Lipoprotein n=1 Tax=Solibacter usitatus (strain Ellin6076) TaxID=234267 RepID=Q025C2_SOLUE
MRVRWFAICALILAITVCISCSSGPTGPEKGTPAFYWQAARETFAAGDTTKTLEHLDKLLADHNEYSDRALTWSLVLTSGLAAGYTELADTYEIGGRVNKSDPSAFRRPMMNYRSIAGRLSLQFGENFAKFASVKGDTVPLAFGRPIGTAATAPGLTRIGKGMVMPAADLENTETKTLERNILLAACSAAGAPDDTAKLESLLKSPDATVPRPVFVMAMARALYNASQLYNNRKLDDPSKLTIFAERAQEAMKSVPDSKEAKELNVKIAETIKKNKRT